MQEQIQFEVDQTGGRWLSVYGANETGAAVQSCAVDVHRLPIRLTHTATARRVLPVAGIKLGIGRCLYLTSDAEQRAEGVERVKAPVEAKRKFVEVSL